MKRNRLLFVLVIVVLSALPAAAGVDVFIEIPGIKGDASGVQPERFKGWFHPLTLHYRLPGIPRTALLEEEGPKTANGFLAADDIKHRYISFSKIEGKSDKKLYDVYNKKKAFAQWKIMVCTDKDKLLLTLILKGVKITKITKRDDKQYITIEFKRVMWNYRPQ